MKTWLHIGARGLRGAAARPARTVGRRLQRRGRRGNPDRGELPLGDAERADLVQRLPPGGLRGLDRPLPRPLPPARARRLDERLDADEGALDELIASGEIQPTIAIMPDAPWSSRASYYVDSAYTGADPGRKVETAFTQDLIAHVDATYRTVADRTGRGVGRLLDGRLRRAPLLARAPRSLRRRDRAQPRRLRPDPAGDSSRPASSARSASARASSSTRSTRSSTIRPSSRRSRPAATSCRCSSPSATTSSRTRIRRTRRTTSTSRPTSSSTRPFASRT